MLAGLLARQQLNLQVLLCFCLRMLAIFDGFPFELVPQRVLEVREERFGLFGRPLRLLGGSLRCF